MVFARSLIVLIVLWGLVDVAWTDEIHEAAEKGDLVRIEKLVKDDPGLIDTVKDGLTPLHHAAANGHIDVAEFLIESGCEVDPKNDTGQTPLLYAVANGKKRMVSFLIGKGSNVNAQHDKNPSPLHYAAARGYKSIASLLIENGARVDIRDYEANTPLHNAASSGHRAVGMLLVEKGAELDARNKRERTPLLLVARECGNAKFAAALLDAGADPDAVDRYGDTPLTLSAWRGYLDVAQVLLDRGAKLPTRKEQIIEMLNYCLQKGLTGQFEMLIAQGIDMFMLNEHKGTLLHSAAKGGSAEIMTMMIDKGLDVNGKDRNGWSPLHCAAYSGHQDAVELLIQKGVDIDSRTLSGCTAFNLAKENGHQTVVDLLDAEGANPGPSMFPELKGAFLGQKRPGDTPEIFAPGIVSAELSLHGNVVFSPDQREAYWSLSFPIPGSGYSRAGIMCMKRKNESWTAPKLAPFSHKQGEDVPFFSPDGQKLFFISRRSTEGGGERTKENIWFMERKGECWSEPKSISSVVNSSQMHWQFSVARSGNIYFGTDRGMMRSRWVSNDYTKPEKVIEVLHPAYEGGCPLIAPDESFLIFSSSILVKDRSDDDLFIGYRKDRNTWTNPINMGDGINTPHQEKCPILSPDGKYLFFLSSRSDGPGVYWVKADIIHTLKPEGIK